MKRIAMVVLVALPLSHFALHFSLYKLGSSDFRSALELSLGDGAIWVDSPQMGYYLVRAGIDYAPLDRSAPRLGEYLLIQDDNIEWILATEPSAETELIGELDSLQGVRGRVTNLTGSSFFANLQLRRVAVPPR